MFQGPYNTKAFNLFLSTSEWIEELGMKMKWTREKGN